MKRRNLLSNMLGFTVGMNPFLALAASAWDKSLKVAPEKKEFLKNYVQFNLAEAPSRWLFDLILKPNINSSFLPHPYIVDRFDGHKFSYEPDFKYGFGLPLIWNLPFTDHKGKTRTATELLPYWGNIRGVRMLRDGHGFNNRRLVAPQAGGISITGQLADRSDTPLASIGWVKRRGGDLMAPLAYRSEAGVGTMVIPAGIGNPFDFIFSGADGGATDESSDQLLDIVEAEIRKDQPHIPNYKEKRIKAKKLLELTMATAKNDFLEIYKRYYDLERQIVTNRHPLLTAKPMPAFNLKSLKNSDINSQKKIDELIAPYCFMNDVVLVNDDLIKSIESSHFKDLPYQFALVEFLLKKQVSQSLVMCLGSLENVLLQSIDKKEFVFGKNTDPQKFKINTQDGGSGWFDAHPIGTVPNFLHTSIFFQVFSASLVVLIDELKENQIFDSTLLHIASEFDREPNDMSDGSDHGIDGNTTSFLSGKIKGPFILGDILKDSIKTESNQKSFGTWGHGAPMSEVYQGFLTYENISSTVAHCMGLPTLTPNKASLLKFENGFIVPAISKGKNI